MNDDFNSPILIAQLFDAVRFINAAKNETASISSEDQEQLLSKIMIFVEDIMGLTLSNSENKNISKYRP